MLAFRGGGGYRGAGCRAGSQPHLFHVAYRAAHERFPAPVGWTVLPRRNRRQRSSGERLVSRFPSRAADLVPADRRSEQRPSRPQPRRHSTVEMQPRFHTTRGALFAYRVGSGRRENWVSRWVLPRAPGLARNVRAAAALAGWLWRVMWRADRAGGGAHGARRDPSPQTTDSAGGRVSLGWAGSECPRRTLVTGHGFGFSPCLFYPSGEGSSVAGCVEVSEPTSAGDPAEEIMSINSQPVSGVPSAAAGPVSR